MWGLWGCQELKGADRRGYRGDHGLKGGIPEATGVFGKNKDRGGWGRSPAAGHSPAPPQPPPARRSIPGSCGLFPPPTPHPPGPAPGLSERPGAGATGARPAPQRPDRGGCATRPRRKRRLALHCPPHAGQPELRKRPLSAALGPRSRRTLSRRTRKLRPTHARASPCADRGTRYPRPCVTVCSAGGCTQEGMESALESRGSLAIRMLISL